MRGIAFGCVALKGEIIEFDLTLALSAALSRTVVFVIRVHIIERPVYLAPAVVARTAKSDGRCRVRVIAHADHIRARRIEVSAIAFSQFARGLADLSLTCHLGGLRSNPCVWVDKL
jgi:hypothetical protein